MPVIAGLRPIKRLRRPCKWLCSLSLLSTIYAPLSYAQENAAESVASSSASGASSSSRSSEAPLYPSRDIRNKTLIANVMDDEAQWLDTEHGKILALYRQTEARQTYGALVLFHSAENPQTWPSMLENLRARLPRYGWETLAISLPHQYPQIIPDRPSSSAASAAASSTSGEPVTEEDLPTPENTEPAETAASSSAESSSSSAASSIVARDKLITANVNAAFEFLKSKGQFNTVILVDNSSANPVLKNLLAQVRDNPGDPKTVDGPIQALIIANLQYQEPLKKTELEEIFSTEQLPVMDVFFTPDNPEQEAARELHRATALRKKVIDYQQQLLDIQPKLVEHDYQSFLLGKVRGFMKQKASGSEIKTAEKAN